MKYLRSGKLFIKTILVFILVIFNFLDVIGLPVLTGRTDKNKPAGIVLKSQSVSELTNYPVYVLRFDAGNSDSYIDCGKSDLFSPAEITLEAWIYFENRLGNYILANESYNSGTGPQGFVLRLTPEGNLEFAVGSNGTWEQLTSTTEIVGLNEWVHVAATFNAGNTMKIFINGVEVNSKTISSGIFPSTQNLFLGESPSWPGRRLTGRLFDIRLWNIARSSFDIIADMNKDLTGIETGLVTNWRLDEGSGATIHDMTSVFDVLKTSGTEWLAFASLEASRHAYLLNQQKDSVIISAKGLNIAQWSLKNSASAGNAYLSTMSSDEAVLVYMPETNSYVHDSITVEGLSADNVPYEVKIHFEIYSDKYQYSGEILMDKILSLFYNSANGLYAENIYPQGGVIQETSYIWPASHLLRAMKFAYRLNPEKYRTILLNYLVALDQYIYTRDGTTGYASYPSDNSTRFYDDNGLFIIQFADLCEDFDTEGLLGDAKLAYFFNNDIRDSHWGIPQNENQLGAGMFYSMAVNQTGFGAAMLYQLTGEQTYLTESINYYEQLTSPSVLLQNQQNKLFNQYTFYQNGKWSLSGMLDGSIANGGGYRAYQTTHVIQHAIRLYQITGDSQYLTEAVAMGNSCRNYFYSQGNGLNENSFWGGNDIIDSFLDLFLATSDRKWRDTCFDIIDYLITYGKDKAGYYPGNYNDAFGKWSLNQINYMPAEINMMGQAAAASGMLHVAYFEANPALSVPGTEAKLITNEIFIYPSILNKGERLNIGFRNVKPEIRSIEIYSSDGQLSDIIAGQNAGSDGEVMNIGTSRLQSGIYIVKVNTNSDIFTSKFLVQ